MTRGQASRTARVEAGRQLVGGVPGALAACRHGGTGDAAGSAGTTHVRPLGRACVPVRVRPKARQGCNGHSAHGCSARVALVAANAAPVAALMSSTRARVRTHGTMPTDSSPECRGGAWCAGLLARASCDQSLGWRLGSAKAPLQLRAVVCCRAEARPWKMRPSSIRTMAWPHFARVRAHAYGHIGAHTRAMPFVCLLVARVPASASSTRCSATRRPATVQCSPTTARGMLPRPSLGLESRASSTSGVVCGCSPAHQCVQ